MKNVINSFSHKIDKIKKEQTGQQKYLQLK